MALARAERRKQAKLKRADILAKEKGVILKNDINDKTIIFDLDGYKHMTCPVADIMDQELMNILNDVLYCIDLGMPPNDGGAMDQSYLFRVAFTTILHEKEIIKNELEKKHIDNAKKKQQSSGKGKGRHGK